MNIKIIMICFMVLFSGGIQAAIVEVKFQGIIQSSLGQDSSLLNNADIALSFQYDTSQSAISIQETITPEGPYFLAEYSTFNSTLEISNRASGSDLIATSFSPTIRVRDWDQTRTEFDFSFDYLESVTLDFGAFEFASDFTGLVFIFQNPPRVRFVGPSALPTPSLPELSGNLEDLDDHFQFEEQGTISFFTPTNSPIGLSRYNVVNTETSFTVIPIPATGWLFLSALAGVFASNIFRDPTFYKASASAG